MKIKNLWDSFWGGGYRDFRDDGDVIVMFRVILVWIVIMCVLLGLIIQGVK
jgi:hypothetical protein